MQKNLQLMRRNERVLIVADVLLRSRSSFMNVFLMAFMMGVSMSQSPSQFIRYSILRHLVVAIGALFLVRSFKKHPLAMWRISVLFAVAEVLIIILADGQNIPTFMLALFSGLESACYWQPKVIIDSAEVSNQERMRFKATDQIFIELTKILMPMILGFAIDGASYQRVAIFVLLISCAQLAASFFLKPTIKPAKGPVQLWRMTKEIFSRESMRNLVRIQIYRGIVTASGPYIVMATYCLNKMTENATERGIASALASALAIVLLAIYRHYAKNLRAQKIILVSLLPAVILPPIMVLFAPADKYIAISFFVLASAVSASLYNSTVGVARISDILCRHVRNEDDRMAVNAIGQLILSVSCMFCLCVLLFIIEHGSYAAALIYVILSSLVIIALTRVALPKTMKYDNSPRCEDCKLKQGSEE